MKKSTFFSDFKKFIAKGNVLDLAVGVVVGGAFNKIVTALVNDIIMPLVGLATGGQSIADLKWIIKEAVYAEDGTTVLQAENALKYGDFLQTIIDFLIIALSVFCVLRVMVKLKTLTEKKEKEEAAAIEAAKEPTPPAETTEDILKDIRELLKK